MVGEGHEGFGKVAAAHLDGAHAEVEVEDTVDVAADVAVVFQEVGDGGVQVHDIGLTSHVLRNKIGLVGGQKVKKSKAAGDAAAATNALIL